MLDNVNYDWLVKVNKNVKTGDKNLIAVFVGLQHPSDKVTSYTLNALTQMYMEVRRCVMAVDKPAITAICTTAAIVFWPICSTRTTLRDVTWNSRITVTYFFMTSVGTSSRGRCRTPTDADCRSCPSSCTTRRPRPAYSTSSKTRYYAYYRY